MVRFRDDVPRKRLHGQLLWFLVWAAVTVFAIALRPSPELHGTHQQLGLPPCPSVALFDRPCFGCGMTTSFTATVHGDLGTAWRAHPFGIAFYALFTLSALLCFWGWRKGLYLDTGSRAFNRLSFVLLVLFVAFGFYRTATTTYGSVEYGLVQQANALTGEEGR
jgi:hypothetical protein